MPTSGRFSRSLSPAAMGVAVLALVLAGAGVGWSASQVTTKDIKNNAVTSPKVKNGSLKATDLVKEKKATPIAAPGGPEFTDGGQGDCQWVAATAVLPGTGVASYRVDRFGIVHLSGIAVGDNGPGGDMDCDFATESEDGLITILPPELRPAESQLVTMPGGSLLYLVGPTALGPELPAGALFIAGTSALLDGISYIPSTSPIAPDPGPRSQLSPEARAQLRQLVGR